MHFKDIGIIISKKAFKEHSYIISVFTKNHGLYSGVVNAISKKSRPIYMEGNLVDFFWKARLIDHLGIAKCDLIKSYSGSLIIDKLKLYAFNSIVNLIKIAFCEREPHNNLFPILKDYLDKTNYEFNFRDYINLELAILSEAGYGLSIDRCAVTGQTKDLYYISPKSGKAVSRMAGEEYKDRLLILPNILKTQSSFQENADAVYADLHAPSKIVTSVAQTTLCNQYCNYNTEITQLDIKQSFALTGYFFNRYFFHNKPEPKERIVFFTTLLS